MTELQRLEAEALDLVRKHKTILIMVPAVRGFLARLATHLHWAQLLQEVAR